VRRQNGRSPLGPCHADTKRLTRLIVDLVFGAEAHDTVRVVRRSTLDLRRPALTNDDFVELLSFALCMFGTTMPVSGFAVVEKCAPV
jgi:hypothetical protein